MTPYYRHLDPKGLRVKEELIIMTEAQQYCENNNVEYIRYSKLKNLCNERLNELTNGASPDMGGNFDNNIKKLVDEGFFKRIQESKRHTDFYPNISKIRTYRLKHVDHSGKSPRVTVHIDLEPESVRVSDGLGMKVIHGHS